MPAEIEAFLFHVPYVPTSPLMCNVRMQDHCYVCNSLYFSQPRCWWPYWWWWSESQTLQSYPTHVHTPLTCNERNGSQDDAPVSCVSPTVLWPQCLAHKHVYVCTLSMNNCYLSPPLLLPIFPLPFFLSGWRGGRQVCTYIGIVNVFVAYILSLLLPLLDEVAPS